jgi:hypothetical protein
MLIIHWFTKVTNHSILQGTVSSRFIRISGDENGRDHVAAFDEMSVELDPAHSRHLNISDQACRFGEEGRFQELGGRGKRLDRVTQHRHELSHGLAKGLIVLDDRYQCTFRHCFSTFFAGSILERFQVVLACMQLRNVGVVSQQCNAGGPKRWLMRSTIRLGSRGCWWQRIVSRIKAIRQEEGGLLCAVRGCLKRSPAS